MVNNAKFSSLFHLISQIYTNLDHLVPVDSITSNISHKIFIIVKALRVLNALHACVYIYIRLSSFRVPTLWFIYPTVATCHIQYIFLSLCQSFLQENRQNMKILGLPFSYDIYENGSYRLLGTQSINTESILRLYFKKLAHTRYSKCFP